MSTREPRPSSLLSDSTFTLLRHPEGLLPSAQEERRHRGRWRLRVGPRLVSLAQWCIRPLSPPWEVPPERNNHRPAYSACSVAVTFITHILVATSQRKRRLAAKILPPRGAPTRPQHPYPDVFRHSDAQPQTMKWSDALTLPCGSISRGGLRSVELPRLQAVGLFAPVRCRRALLRSFYLCQRFQAQPRTLPPRHDAVELP